MGGSDHLPSGDLLACLPLFPMKKSEPLKEQKLFSASDDIVTTGFIDITSQKGRNINLFTLFRA